MAELLGNASQQLIYLSKYHLFGRKRETVDTYLSHLGISRLHMLIEWRDEAWFLKDMSKNGVWLNNVRLNPAQEYQLKQGDTIALNSMSDITFVVANLDAPKDVLIPSQPKDIHDERIFLEQLHLLPDDNSPEIVLSHDRESGNWLCENVNNTGSYLLADGDKVQFAGTEWQLFTGVEQKQAETIALEARQEPEIKYVFRISQDEEHAELIIEHQDTVIDMDVRCHHYLTALLARYKKQMAEKELDENLIGWIPIKKLSRDLGLSESHINIQIHRARKQLIDQFKRFGLCAPDLIERRKGYARFASDNFRIFKGEALEC